MDAHLLDGPRPRRPDQPPDLEMTMDLWSKLTGGQPATPAPTGRTPREHDRRNREIRKIDAGTANWLRRGGTGPRKGN